MPIRCLVQGDSLNDSIRVYIEGDKEVSDLKELIKDKIDVPSEFKAKSLVLWKVQIPTNREEVFADLKSRPADAVLIDIEGSERIKDPTLKISTVFPPPIDLSKEGYIHIIVENPVQARDQLGPQQDIYPTGNLKVWKCCHVHILTVHFLSSVLRRKLTELSNSDDEHARTYKRTKLTELSNSDVEHARAYKRTKKFPTNGTVQPEDYGAYFIADQTEENTPFIEHIINQEFVRYHAPRASGKSTRMLQLTRQLQLGINSPNGFKKFECFYVDFQGVCVDQGLDVFWSTVNNAFPKSETLPVPITDASSFQMAFKKEPDESDKPKRWKLPVVLLFDEFDKLFPPSASLARNSCLEAIRFIRNNRNRYVIESIISIGTFGVVMLNQDTSTSPFNVTESLGGNSLSKNQIEDLFKQFCDYKSVNIDSRIIEDIYARTNGHAAMVCLCGRSIDNLLGGQISFESWQSFVVTGMQREVMSYPTFKRLLGNLRSEQMKDGMALLQRMFLANPDPICVTSDRDIMMSELLAKEGALVVTDTNTFVMASSLLRSLIMKSVISGQMPCPSTEVPLRQDKSLNVLETLKAVVPIFVQQDMKNAAKFSFKVAPVLVNNASKEWVPRESVYQQQLVGILANWLGAIKYELIGQFHTREALGNPRYCDVVLTAPNTPDGDPGSTTILELLATSTDSELRAHYKRALEYAEILEIRNFQPLRDIWVVHFTCEDGATKEENCSWPSKEEQAKNLNAVVFWHNLDFTEIRMSACWKDQEGEAMQEVYDELVSPGV